MQVQTKGQVKALFRSMRIPHRRIDALKEALDAMRECKRLVPSLEQGCMMLLAPSQSGKSTAVKYYIETTVLDELIADGTLDPDIDRVKAAKKQKIVVHMVMSSKVSVKGFASDLLRALGDPRYSHGTEANMKQRAYDNIIKLGTQLLVIDEVQHVLGAKAEETSASDVQRERTSSSHVTNSMKLLLIEGVVPVLLVGLPEARSRLMSDTQIASRQQGELNFEPLLYNVEDDRTMFERFVESIEDVLVANGLADAASKLLTKERIAKIYEVSQGHIGWAARLIERGCEVALEMMDSKLREKHPVPAYRGKLVADHLEIAVDEWAIRNGLADHNPFR